jgi:bacteriocin-like protein
MASEKTSLKLDAAVGRAIRDAKFREKLVNNATEALKEEGLTDEELAQVSGGIAGREPFLRNLSTIFEKPGMPVISMACWCTDKICYERG